MGGMRRLAHLTGLVALLAGCSSPQGAGALGPGSPEIRRGLCPARGSCEVESVLDAGQGPGGELLVVVRLRIGPPRCTEEGERAYQDWLASAGAGRVRPLRELAYGDAPCLEWEPSAWTFEGGELVFHHGMMGAPPGSGVDVRRVHVRFRPWPLEVLGASRGDEPMRPDPIPEHGPVFFLSMDEEGSREAREQDPSTTSPPGWTR